MKTDRHIRPIAAPFHLKRIGVGIVLFVLVLLPTLAVAQSPATTERPNIVFILVDDLRWDAMGFTGKYPFLKTPYIDKLRQEGVYLENAFVSHSLCAPSRATFLTGTFSQTHGVTTNQEGREFDVNHTPSFPLILQQNGYRTAFIGKWHMGTGRAPREGFNYWCSFAGQGRYYDNVLNINGETVQNDGYITTELNRYAVEFLENAAAGDDPFMLFLSHKAVHEPFTPAEEHSAYYEDVLIAEPGNWQDDLADKPAWQRRRPTPEQRKRYRKKELKDVKVITERSAPDWNPTTGRGRQKDYLRCLSAVDEGVGEIYEVLDREGLLDNTLIVFAGDNGFLHGEHGRGDKRVAYNESIRIPLVMRFPARIAPASTVSELVLNADVAPTLLDFAGVPVPEEMQGESMVPLLTGEPVEWRSSFLYTYWEDLIRVIPRIVGVRTHRYLYATTPDIDDIDELYDLKDDPFELRNLANDPAYHSVKQELQMELERLKQETGYRKVVPRPDTASTSDYATGPLLSLDFGDGELEGIEQISNVDMITVHGRSFAKFNADATIVTKAEQVDASVGRMIIECMIRPTKGDGLIVSSGSDKNGWAMFLEAQRPGMVAALNSRTHFVDADTEVPLNADAHLVVVIDNVINRLSIYVNGRLAGTQQGFLSMTAAPDDHRLSIGMDVEGKVEPEKISGFRFEGLMEYLRIYRDTTPTLLSEILMTGEDAVTGIADDDSAKDGFSLSVFPNPTTPDSIQVFVETVLDSPVRIRVLDSTGRILRDQVFKAQQVIDGKGLSSAGMTDGGLYIIEVAQGKFRAQKKVIMHR